MNIDTEGQLRVWWNCNFGNPGFKWEVNTLKDAALILRVLTKYDYYINEEVYGYDYSDSGGLEVFKDGEWEEWENSDYETFDETREEYS